MCAYAQDAHMQYPQTETPNFACGCWFSVSCLMPFKTLAQLLLQCSVIQGLKMKLKIPQTTGKKRTKTIPTFQSHQVEKVHVNRNTKAMCFFSYIHMLFFFFFLLFISLRSNQNWSEQYGTLRTNSAVNRAFGRMQLRALRREGNTEATQYLGTKEIPLMPTLRARVVLVNCTDPV